jgi:hypothetical protein
VVVGIGGEFLAFKLGGLFPQRDDILLCTIEHGLEIVKILACKSFCSQNDLMFAVYKRLCVIPLQDPVRSGHFGGFVIDRITLDLFTFAAEFGVAILQEFI